MSLWLIETLVASTLLMLLVLLVRRPAARLFGAHVAYALWALPVLRLVLPPIPGWTAMYVPVAVVGDPVMVGLTDPVTAAAMTAPLMAPLPIDAATTDWAFWALAVWGLGAVLWIGWQVLRYQLFLRAALNGARLLTRQGGTDIWMTPAVDGPMAAGVVRKRIFLPADFQTRYSPEERRLALLHEGAHHDRGDLLANFVGLGVVAAHWWNPVAHMAWRAFRADQELACDATVLAGADRDRRSAYGAAVLKSACSRTPTAACAMNHKAQLKQRLVMMREQPRGILRHLVGGLLALSLVGGGLVLTASAAAPVAPVVPVVPAAPMTPAAAVPTEPNVPAVTAVAVLPAAPVAPVAPAIAPDPVRLAEAQARSAETQARAAEAQARWAETQARIGEKAARAGMAQARAQMAAQCAAAGTPVSTDASMAALALCQKSLRTTVRASVNASVRASLEAARASVEVSQGLAGADRARAMAALEKAMRKLDRDLGKVELN